MPLEFGPGDCSWTVLTQIARTFRPSPSVIGMYAIHFPNQGTFKAYCNAMVWAHRALYPDLPEGLAAAVKTAARDIRGRGSASVEKPRLRTPHVRKAILAAVAVGRYSFGRIYAIARHFMPRVSNELLPLQLDGRHGLGSRDTTWHSQVLFPDSTTAIIRLRSRKNAASGDDIMRRCICDAQGPAMCGVCALRGAVAAHRAAGRRPTDRIFAVDAKEALAFLRAVTTAAGGLRPTWHAFRRGYATDLLASGQDWGAVMLAGGWRSNAFLDYLRSRELTAQAAGELVFSFSDSEAE